uniref:Uncharacterized protein n=1 Tax=Anguilla anguilla TaxID=7936 RepID=A0A0E9TKB0_ANGAN
MWKVLISKESKVRQSQTSFI